MSDNPIIPNPETDPTPQADTPNKSQERITQLISEKKAMQAELDRLKAEKQAEADKILADQNQWKTLYEQEKAAKEALNPYKDKAAALEATIQASNEADLARIPEDKKSLVPDYGDPVKLRGWLDKNMVQFAEIPRPQAPNLNGGAMGNTGIKPYKLSQQELEYAAAVGMSPDEYAAMKSKRGSAIDIDNLRQKKE